MRLKRLLLPPEGLPKPMRGRDVLAVKRALHRVEVGFFPKPPGGFDDVYNAKTADAVQMFKRAAGLLGADRGFGQRALDELEPYFDAYGKLMYTSYRVPPVKSPAELAFDRMYAEMKLLSDKSAGYLLGAGHGVPLENRDPGALWDCSSSSSKVLLAGGMFPESYAWVSGKYATSYGVAGPGKLFTVYANAEHVFIRLHKTLHWRFDTSPHASGRPSEDPRRGPRLRYLPRFTSSFAVRHWPGM